MPEIHPQPARLKELFDGSEDGPIVMINLLRFRERARYPESFDSGSFNTGSLNTDCTGREAYRRYGELAVQKVRAVGGRPIWAGDVSTVVIGPEAERWDEAILVRYPSRASFRRMIEDPEYREIAVHRTAALADSRLIATTTTLDLPPSDEA